MQSSKSLDYYDNIESIDKIPAAISVQDTFPRNDRKRVDGLESILAPFEKGDSIFEIVSEPSGSKNESKSSSRRNSVAKTTSANLQLPSSSRVLRRDVDEIIPIEPDSIQNSVMSFNISKLSLLESNYESTQSIKARIQDVESISDRRLSKQKSGRSSSVVSLVKDSLLKGAQSAQDIASVKRTSIDPLTKNASTPKTVDFVDQPVASESVLSPPYEKKKKKRKSKKVKTPTAEIDDGNRIDPEIQIEKVGSATLNRILSEDALKRPKTIAEKEAKSALRKQLKENEIAANQERLPLLFEALGKDARAFKDMITSLYIYKSDSLESALNLQHPVVQVHILDKETGVYWPKSDITRRVTYPNEPEHITYILPTTTKPFQLHLQETKTPAWNQEIVFNELYLHFIDPRVLLIFEVLDFVTNSKALIEYPDGWNRIAWGFLKPVGGDGRSTTEKEARLQLYKYPKRMRLKAILGSSSPQVYNCWKRTWKKYPSTLYVKLFAHKPLAVISKSNILSQSISEQSNIQLKLLLGKLKPKWRRKPEEICKLPNKLLYRIEAGSFSCAFSNQGFYLAVANVCFTSYPIKIYKIDTGARIATLEGHQDLVYQLTWQLISASSDGSVRIWSFLADDTVHQSRILLHPTFVYTAVFYPNNSAMSTVVTGAYDGQICFWHCTQQMITDQSNTPDKKLFGHKSNINSLCFNTDGTRLYSGDGSGFIKVWSNENLDSKKSDKFEFECIKTIDSLKGHPIQALRMHPSNRKMMVQTLGPGLHMLDTRIHRILTHFELSSKRAILENPPTTHISSYPEPFGKETGTSVKHVDSIHQISSARFLKCCFSACGTYVFVGSTQGTVHFWRSESGVYLGSYCNLILPSWTDGIHPIVDISFHPHDHLIAFSVWGEKEPIRVFTWDEKKPDIKTRDLESIGSLKKLNIETPVTNLASPAAEKRSSTSR